MLLSDINATIDVCGPSYAKHLLVSDVLWPSCQHLLQMSIWELCQIRHVWCPMVACLGRHGEKLACTYISITTVILGEFIIVNLYFRKENVGTWGCIFLIIIPDRSKVALAVSQLTYNSHSPLIFCAPITCRGITVSIVLHNLIAMSPLMFETSTCLTNTG